MSYLLFMDESGHDHRNMPYEVRGGIALHASQVWPFVLKMGELEQEAYGVALHEFQTEIKGSKLLDRDRFKWAAQDAALNGETRRAHATAFLHKKQTGATPTRQEFTAYGQASLLMARGIFRLLRDQDARLFASAVPRGAARLPATANPEDLRKDIVFLLERYGYFLEERNETGLMVLDETDKSDDRRQVRRLARYFTLTKPGRERARRIVPSPLFVSSDMTYPVQAADLCIYCINWGFRIPNRGMDAPIRTEIAEMFGPLVRDLQWQGEGRRGDGSAFACYGVVCVPDLYTSRGAAAP